ncbi:hypothetical protein [Streptomyces cavernae]|uniref:hypothetical protein n=1 Tax=Streptomyces cavernae TaxID=2259034 RepID=UPI000FEBF69D|nr:hypothetical protein [Streptomyces cavernae]
MKRRPLSALTLVSATLALCGLVTESASASTPRVSVYFSAVACQTAGNMAAQKGELTGFECIYMGILDGCPVYVLRTW